MFQTMSAQRVLPHDLILDWGLPIGGAASLGVLLAFAGAVGALRWVWARRRSRSRRRSAMRLAGGRVGQAT